MLKRLVWMTLVTCAAFAPRAASAQVTTADLAWLAGRWIGSMTGDTASHTETLFSPPNAGTITGVMRLIQRDKVGLVELITLVDTPAGLEMRFRHFSPSLEAYETTYQQNMRLTSHTAGDFVFENAFGYDEKLMSTQPRITHFIQRGANEFIGRSEILTGISKPATIEVTYRRATEK